MTDPEYRSMVGLSNSVMKDLAVSPLRYWFHQINPNRPVVEPTQQMILGSALHCAVLEPDKFEDHYVCDIRSQDYEGCLVTMDHLRDWLREKGLPVTGKLKQDLVDRVVATDPSIPIIDVLRKRFLEEAGKRTILNREDMDRVMNMAIAVRSEPSLAPILADGRAEVPMFAVDPETGVLLKSRMDWVTPTLTLDLKTFSQSRGKSIDKSIADAIFYECYYRQAYLYTFIRTLQKKANTRYDFVMPFVESEEPHEVRIKVLRPVTGGQPNLYWERARVECRELIRLYAECRKKFGDGIWRDERSIEPLVDEDISQIAW